MHPGAQQAPVFSHCTSGAQQRARTGRPSQPGWLHGKALPCRHKGGNPEISWLRTPFCHRRGGISHNCIPWALTPSKKSKANNPFLFGINVLSADF